MRISVLSFDDLDARTAYALWRLRQQVFVVEQHSPYPDLDGRDLEPATRHVLATDGDELVGASACWTTARTRGSVASWSPSVRAAAASPVT